MEDNIVKATITADDTNTLNNDINVESSQNNITKSIISNNNGENILETMILPVNPITQEHQQYLLYVPVATAGRHIGISSYDDDDFIVNDKGFVKLALSRQSIVQQFSDVNLKIDNEISRATNTESTLNLKIDNEISRATNIESTLNLKINNETSRAREAESKLSARIEEINADMDFDNYYNKNEVDELFVTNTALEEKHYATEDYVNLNGGKIDVIKVNSVSQEIVDKEVNIIVPTKYSELLNDNNTVKDANYVHTDNNYTTEEKEKLFNLNNYNDTELRNLINTTNENTLFVTKSYTDAKISSLINQAPETLDTFKEIADALAEDQTALDTLNLAIGNKVNKTLKINGKTLEQDINLTAADVGALSNFTETDPTVPSHVKNITSNDITSWNNKLSSIPIDYKTKNENDALYQPKGNYLTSFTETDPTVPAWAKEPNKPSYEYSEINNTPTIPIVNDATILITQGGNFKGSFTLNQSTGVHIDLDEGGGEAPTVDSALSETSTNPVQNKVINEALSNVTQNVNLLSEQKANSDARNLTDLNIAAWKEKLQLGLPLGMIISSAIVQNDAGLRLLDGSSLSLNGTYKAFCDYLVARYIADNTSVPVYFDIQEYANDMNDYGQCGCFVYNAGSSTLTSTPRNSTDLAYSVSANSLKLPTITEFIASNNGGLVLGLAELDSFKSHTHTITQSRKYNYTASGSYYEATIPDNVTDINSGTTTTNTTGGNETKPKNVRYPYYIVVATVTKTDIEVNIDNVASDLNNLSNAVQNKAQSDLSNVLEATLKNKALGLTALWTGSQTGTGTLSLAQSFLNFNFLYVLGRNSNNEYCTGVITTSIFNNTSNTYPYGFANNSKDSNRFVNLYKASNTSITIKSIGSMTLLGVYGL